MTLHLLWAHPSCAQTLQDCLLSLAPGDALVLGGDAVRALEPGTPVATRLAALDGTTALFALAADCAALGIAIPPRARAVTPADLVALACAHARSVSWF